MRYWGGASGEPVATLGADVPCSTITFAPTGLVVPVSGRVMVELFGSFSSVIATTGIAFALDVGPGMTVLGFGWHPTSATGMGSFEQVTDATTTGATSGVRLLNAVTPVMARWIVQGEGQAELMVRSEVALSAVTLKAGSILRWKPV